MAKVNLINKESIPALFDSLTDTIVKSLDEFDLFKYDGLLSSLPFGKMISFATKRIIQIQDVKKALYKAVTSSALFAYIDGLRKYDINPIVEDTFLKEHITQIKVQNSAITFDYETFDINSFNKNDVVKHIQKVLVDFSASILKGNEGVKVRKHLKDHHKQYFLKILEEEKIVFEKLSAFFEKDSYDETINNIKRDTYRYVLANQFDELILNDPKGLKLSDIYIEPEFNIHKNCFVEKDQRLRRKSNLDDKGFVKYNDSSVHDFVHSFLLGEVDGELKSKRANICFILGYPGQGKSSFCKKLLNDCIRGARLVEKDVYLVKFRNLTNTSDLIYSPINTLYDFMLGQVEFTVSKNDFRNSILVLDGLDELFMKENLQFSSIDEFCRVLIREIEEHDFPKVIITSRYGYVNTERLKSENALIVQLQEFDIDKQKKWLSVYTKFHPETLLSIKKLSDINKDKRYSYLKELITQPILLHLVASLEEEIQIDTNRAKIYEDLFTQLIKRNWAKEGQIDNLIGVGENDLREFLREVAFSIFLSGNEYINKSTLISLPSTRSFLDKLHNKEFQDSLKRIMIAFYFQEVKRTDKDEIRDDKSDYAIEFLHRSLQEYLVAEKIWNSVILLADRNSRTQKFNIDDDKTAFELISSLFAKRYLSKEISDYLEEIIKNDITIDKNVLCERLEKFLPFFLDGDFVYRNLITTDKNIIMAAISNFSGYWLLLSSMGQKRNLVPKDQKEKFSFFLRLSTKETSTFNLSFQDLSDANLMGVDLTGSDLSFSNFSNCIMQGADLSNCNLSSTNFKNAYLYRATVENSILANTDFTDSVLVSAIFYNQDLRTCTLEGADLKGTVLARANIQGVSLAGCFLEQTNFNGASGQSLDQFEDVILEDDSCFGITPEIYKHLLLKLQKAKKD